MDHQAGHGLRGFWKGSSLLERKELLVASRYRCSSLSISAALLASLALLSGCSSEEPPAPPMPKVLFLGIPTDGGTEDAKRNGFINCSSDDGGSSFRCLREEPISIAGVETARTWVQISGYDKTYSSISANMNPPETTEACEQDFTKCPSWPIDGLKDAILKEGWIESEYSGSRSRTFYHPSNMVEMVIHRSDNSVTISAAEPTSRDNAFKNIANEASKAAASDQFIRQMQTP